MECVTDIKRASGQQKSFLDEGHMTILQSLFVGAARTTWQLLAHKTDLCGKYMTVCMISRLTMSFDKVGDKIEDKAKFHYQSHDTGVCPLAHVLSFFKSLCYMGNKAWHVTIQDDLCAHDPAEPYWWCWLAYSPGVAAGPPQAVVVSSPDPRSLPH